MFPPRRDGQSGPRAPEEQMSLGQGRIRRNREQGRIRRKGIWQVDGDDAEGDFDRSQPGEEKPASKAANVFDQDGYQVVKMHRVSGNCTPEIFAVGRLTDRGVKPHSGSIGSRTKATSGTCSSLPTCTSRSSGFRFRITNALRITRGDVSQDQRTRRTRTTWRSFEVIS